MNDSSQQEAIQALVKREPVFQRVVDRYGPPPFWKREVGFSTLVRIILEQQVSLASAKAAFDRLLDAVEKLTPRHFMGLSDTDLKTIGFSRQKTVYSRALATALICGDLSLTRLEKLSDEEVRQALTAIKGIGIWTANIYLMMAMQRPDIWPRGDIALASAYQRLKGWDERPDNAALEKIAAQWAPWRSTAARLLWHFYLSE